MVNATVDNDPVSIILDGGQSTTVPGNETWKVTITLASGTNGITMLKIDGIGKFLGRDNNQGNESIDAVLTGGQTIVEARDDPTSAIFISGFVVDS
jgi:hypothetical protein